MNYSSVYKPIRYTPRVPRYPIPRYTACNKRRTSAPMSLVYYLQMDQPRTLYTVKPSDEEEHLEKEDDEDEYISDRNDSASNLSEPVTESLDKLKCAFSDMSTTITGLQREQENCKHKLQEDIQRVIIIRNQVQQEMEDQMYILHGEINTLRNQLNDDIEQLKYKSDERIRDLEDQLEKHKTAVALLEDRQAEIPSDDMIPNDIRTRWRDLMSSLITLGLAIISFLLFLFTTVVDFVKIFSENNALSTGLSLALFAVIIAAYYYFDTASRTVHSS